MKPLDQKRKEKKVKRILILTVLALFILSGLAIAGQKTITFQWDYPSPPSDLGGFNFYTASKAGGPYTKATSIPYVAGQTQYTSAQNLTSPDGAETVMYFVVSAYDKSNNESVKSNEVTYTFDFLAPPGPINFIIKVVTP